MKNRIVICDDNQNAREFIRFILEPEEDFIIIAEAVSGISLLNACRKECPDLILLDINMDTVNDGLNTLNILRQEFPALKVIMLTVYDDDYSIITAFKNGADNYLLKSSIPTEILSIMRNTLSNKDAYISHVSSSLKNYLITNANALHKNYVECLKVFRMLTHMEVKILKMVRSGYTQKEISEKEYIALGTVKSHVNRILKKLSEKNLKEAIVSLEKIDFFQYVNQL